MNKTEVVLGLNPSYTGCYYIKKGMSTPSCGTLCIIGNCKANAGLMLMYRDKHNCTFGSGQQAFFGDKSAFGGYMFSLVVISTHEGLLVQHRAYHQSPKWPEICSGAWTLSALEASLQLSTVDITKKRTLLSPMLLW